ncbi:MAG: glycerophosphodiester phosphodiesterase family protein, partial [Christensenellales bacterium]|nr:glycerophosphodiester phosphodiesterase family protein [Christensenellales bacterium]
VAVHHDNSLKRVCGKDVKIESLTSEQLKDYPMTLGGEIIPTLPEMLKLVDGKVPILIELKTLCGWRNNSLAKAVLRDLKDYPYKDVIALQSFDPFAVKWCRKHQSEYPFGQLASGVGEKGKTPKFLNDLMGHLVVNKLSKPMFTSYDVNSAPNEYIAKTRESMPVFAWTIRNEKDLEKARAYADNIIFENLSLDLLK